nr:immunoglobulin light chain junction region [Macaca mulatta]
DYYCYSTDDTGNHGLF